MNQQLTFLSDGGDTVRDLQLYLSPEAEHLLDWFHVAMRLTVLQQTAKGLPDKTRDDEEAYPLRDRDTTLATDPCRVAISARKLRRQVKVLRAYAGIPRYGFGQPSNHFPEKEIALSTEWYIMTGHLLEKIS
jgi:hypothetical protein